MRPVLVETLADDPLQLRGDERRQARRRLGQDGRDGLGAAGTGEGVSTAQHLVNNTPKTENVAGGIDRLTPKLLRRHVRKRSRDYAEGGAGQRRGVVRLRTSGQAEVQDFYLSARGEHDVLRLDVPMDDAVRVCFGERACELAERYGSHRLARVDRFSSVRPASRLPRTAWRHTAGSRARQPHKSRTRSGARGWPLPGLRGAGETCSVHPPIR